MNWYKLAQTTDTLDYFAELDIFPDIEKTNSLIQEKINARILGEIGRGDNGIAYDMSNGDVLKITTNSQEYKIALYLMQNPNKYIAEYKQAWQEGDLYFIVIEKLKDMVVNHPMIVSYFEDLVKIAKQKSCFNPSCFLEILENNSYVNSHPYTPIVKNYLDHLTDISSLRLFDIINPANIGISKDDGLKFFDIN